MADDKTESARDEFRRACDLEHIIAKTRDALRVIARGLEDMAERHATPDAGELTQGDASALYGAAALLDCVAGECDRALSA